MKNEEFLISIVGKQYFGQESDETILDTVGSYNLKDGVGYITYKEYIDNNPEKYNNATLKIEKNNVITLSKENSSTMLILEKGRRHHCMYDTGYGSIKLGVFTSEFINNLNENGGKLDVTYTLDIDANLSSKNELSIEIKPNVF